LKNQVRNYSVKSQFLKSKDCSVNDLRKYVEVEKLSNLKDYPHAAEITSEVIVYDWKEVRETLGSAISWNSHIRR
jgi:hypothetical protein